MFHIISLDGPLKTASEKHFVSKRETKRISMAKVDRDKYLTNISIASANVKAGLQFINTARNPSFSGKLGNPNSLENYYAVLRGSKANKQSSSAKDTRLTLLIIMIKTPHASFKNNNNLEKL